MFFRDWRTVSKWEYVAMIVSWTKSGVVLRQAWRNYVNNVGGGAGFPDNKVDYAIFGIVRFLVFGGLYKMVQAGLRKEWERKSMWEPRPKPTRVSRSHRVVPGRLQRRVGGTVVRQGGEDPLDTLEGRKAYWAAIGQMEWRW